MSLTSGVWSAPALAMGDELGTKATEAIAVPVKAPVVAPIAPDIATGVTSKIMD